MTLVFSTDEISIEELVKDCYLQYASEVIAFRSLPDYRDGLKRVQRRILLTLSDLGTSYDFHKSASVIGETIKRYHPHGDSAIYDSIVTLVNSRCPLLIGEGNFGYRGLEEYPPAAFRYTSVGLSELGKFFLELRKFSSHFTNENDHDEVEYLPTPVPYALLSGSVGVGVGVATVIPRFNASDLLSLVIKILKKEKCDDFLVRPSGGTALSEEDLINLNNHGYGSIVYKPRIGIIYDEPGYKSYSVSVESEYVNLKRILVEFKNEIEEDMVYVVDKTSGNVPSVIVGRTKRVRKITDEEILERLKKCLVRTVKANIVVSWNGVARRVGVKEYVQNCIEFCLKAYRSNLLDVLEKIERKIRIEKVKHFVPSLLTQGLDTDRICENLSSYGVSKEDVEYLLSRPISSLRPELGLEDRRRSLEEKLNNLENSYIEDYISKLKEILFV